MERVKLNFEVVNKDDIPDLSWKRKVKLYQPIFDKLSFNQAVKIVHQSYRAAHRQQTSMQASISALKLDYKLCGRVLPDGEKYILYVWKKAR